MGKKLNQKGQALIAVMVLCLFFIAGFAGFEAYWGSLVSVQTQYRDAVNLMDAVDKASSDIRSSWDLAAVAANNTWVAAGSPPSPDPTYPTPAVINTYVAANLPPLDPSCSIGAGCTATNCCPATAVLCYSNPTNSNFPFCFFNNAAAAGSALAGLDFRVVLPEKKQPGIFEKYFNKTGVMIANFVLKLRGQGLIESESLATPTVIVGRTDAVGTSPTCLAATCITCGAAVYGPNAPMCATIYACPSSYPQCSTYNAAPSPGGAVFVQQFSLTPVGGS